LRDIDRNKVLWELAESFADVMYYREPFSQNLASIRKSTFISGGPACILQDDVEIFRCFHEALVLDDVRVLWITRNTVNSRSISGSKGVIR
jgi:hypothetical protein